MIGISNLLKSRDDISPFLLRLLLATVMFPHGAQKVLGWFGGYGFAGTMNYFTQSLHIPYVLGMLAIIAEFAGSIALAFGFLSRVAAFGIGVTISVAALLVHVPNGVFMNWFGNQTGEGFEYHILMAAIALAVVIQGGGKFSIDSWALRKRTTDSARASNTIVATKPACSCSR